MATREIAAYSRLSRLLRDRHWNVVDLQRRLLDEGVNVDRKTLYRLASNSPVGKTEIALVGRICDVLGVGLDDFFRFARSLPSGEPDEFWELPIPQVERLNNLGHKNNEGTISTEERRELADLVAEYETIAQHNARVRLWRHEPARFDDAQSVAAKA
jgi:hypothetical protein